MRDLSVSHSRINFGQLVIGNGPATKRIYISHIGDEPLEIHNASVDIAGFEVSHFPSSPSIAESYQQELVDHFPATVIPDRFVYGTNTLCVEVQVGPDVPVGEFRGQLVIETNVEKSIKTEVVGQVVNRITAHPGFLFLGGNVEQERMIFVVRDGRNYRLEKDQHEQDGLELLVNELRPGVFEAKVAACDLAATPSFVELPFRCDETKSTCRVTFPVWHPDGGFKVAEQGEL